MFQGIFKFFLLGLLACTSAPAKDTTDVKKSEAPVETEAEIFADEHSAPSEVKSKSSAKGAKKKKAADELAKSGDGKSAKPGDKKKKAAAEKLYDADLGEVEKRYAAAKSVKMDVKKSLILSVLERTDVYDGQFFLSGKEKLRLEFEKPVKSVAVLNGKDFWVIEYPPADVEDKVRVLKSTLGEKSQSQVLVTSLMGRGRILDHFKIESKKKKDGKLVFGMKPSGPATEITSLELTVNEADKLIAEISYEDELENKTKFEFSGIEFDTDVPEKLFKYSPPKGAEISQL